MNSHQLHAETVFKRIPFIDYELIDSGKISASFKFRYDGRVLSYFNDLDDPAVEQISTDSLLNVFFI
jgi:hypothetical protein